MSSIGPQLPPHLSKRKRSPDDGNDDPPSPASKLSRTNETSSRNQNEIDLGESDDDYGPSAPSGPSAAAKDSIAPSIGPSIGPSLPQSNQDEIDLEDSEDDGPRNIGPSAPPAPQPAVAKPSVGPSIGPAAPDAESSSDDDDDYGPSLPNASNAPKRPLGPALPPVEAAPQRDSWMLAPPTKSSYTERDPTRIRARKFASNPGGRPSASSGGGVSSIWTETPEEKLRRLQDNVLGRSGPAEDSTAASGKQKSKEEEERDRRIAANIESQRGRSLYDEHQQRKKKAGGEVEEEDDPSKRGFDREKDMALGGQLGTAQRRELLNKSANFGGRFSKGSFL